MNIKKTQAIKIGTWSINEKNKLNVTWEEIYKFKKKEAIPTVYLITIDNEIKKIGRSFDKNGIIKRMQRYNQGDASLNYHITMFCINNLIKNAIRKNKKVELYIVEQESMVEVKVNSLFGTHIIIDSVSSEILEHTLLEDFYKSEGCYPEWNITETHTTWETVAPDVVKKFNKINKK